MISQADATISPATTTNISPHHHIHHHHHHTNHHDLHTNLLTTSPKSPQSNQLIAHNGKSTRDFNNVIKKRKRFEETIIDGYAITSFKTWEDLQDELNECASVAEHLNVNRTDGVKSIDDTKTTSTTNKKFDTAVKKVSSKIKHAKSSTANKSTTSSSTANSVATSTTSSATSTSGSTKDCSSSSSKKKDKSKKSNNQVLSGSKDKRNKTSSSSKDPLKRALEEKELAEKRISILQEQLKKEQTRNKNQEQVLNHKNTTASSNNISANNNDPVITRVIPPDSYNQTSNMTTNKHIQNQFDHNVQSAGSTNGILRHDLMKDPASIHKGAQNYTPYQLNSQLHRTNSVVHHSIQIQTPSSPNRQTLSQPQNPPNKHLHPSNHSTSTPPPHTPHHIHQSPNQSLPGASTHLPSTLNIQQSNPASHASSPHKTPIHPTAPQSISNSQQTTTNQAHQQFIRLPQVPNSSGPPPSAIHPHLMTSHLHPSQMLHYPHQQPNPMMTPIGLPYSCPPSICITDTISRQTSIIPPPGPMLEQSSPSAAAAAAAAACRFNHSSVLQSITPYNPATVPPHHPMYYPTLPTERSFIEFARSYSSPGYLAYPNLMGTFSAQPPGLTANPYALDRWPRVPIDHQRSVSRYNSIYQNSPAITDRSYANYTSTTRPPTFPTGLFVSDLRV